MYDKRWGIKMVELKQLKIETYNLVDFVMQIQQAVLGGYIVTDKSDEAPMCIGHCYHVIMREAVKPVKVVDTFVVEASIDTAKLQEQLKSGGEIEQMLADSLVVDEKLDGVPIPEPEPTMDEALPKDEQIAPIKRTTRGRK